MKMKRVDTIGMKTELEALQAEFATWKSVGDTVSEADKALKQQAIKERADEAADVRLENGSSIKRYDDANIIMCAAQDAKYNDVIGLYLNEADEVRGINNATVELLVKQVGHPDKKTALMYAVEAKNYGAVSSILGFIADSDLRSKEYADRVINIEDVENKTALNYFFKGDDICMSDEVAKRFVNARAKFHYDGKLYDIDNVTALTPISGDSNANIANILLIVNTMSKTKEYLEAVVNNADETLAPKVLTELTKFINRVGTSNKPLPGPDQSKIEANIKLDLRKMQNDLGVQIRQRRLQTIFGGTPGDKTIEDLKGIQANIGVALRAGKKTIAGHIISAIKGEKKGTGR